MDSSGNKRPPVPSPMNIIELTFPLAFGNHLRYISYYKIIFIIWYLNFITLVAIEIGAIKVIPKPIPNKMLKVIPNNKNECLIVIDESMNEMLFKKRLF